MSGLFSNGQQNKRAAPGGRSKIHVAKRIISLRHFFKLHERMFLIDMNGGFLCKRDKVVHKQLIWENKECTD